MPALFEQLTHSERRLIDRSLGQKVLGQLLQVSQGRTDHQTDLRGRPSSS